MPAAVLLQKKGFICGCCSAGIFAGILTVISARIFAGISVTILAVVSAGISAVFHIFVIVFHGLTS